MANSALAFRVTGEGYIINADNSVSLQITLAVQYCNDATLFTQLAMVNVVFASDATLAQMKTAVVNAIIATGVSGDLSQNVVVTPAQIIIPSLIRGN